MQHKPIAKLDIGSINSVNIPEYSGFYRLQRCGDKVGLFPQPPGDTQPVASKFLVLPQDTTLTFAAKCHGGLQMPFFEWCEVYELY